ncbi:MAG: hypothetical protein NC350_05780 [Corallococcus sp.]|nr:hypothetical protein [Corallococcus sp.]
MEAPVLEIFDDDSLINKQTELMHDKSLAELEVLCTELNVNTALFVFIRKDIGEYFDLGKAKLVHRFKNASNYNDCYLYDNKFLIAFSALGDAAAAAMMEELGFAGITEFFACGSAGNIGDTDVAPFRLVERAIRDEGTSYKYLPPDVYAYPDRELTEVIARYLQDNGFQFGRVTTWTTSAFFAETAKAVERRRQQGATAVDMECSCWCAVAKKRGYKFAQLLFFSDVVSCKTHEWLEERKHLRQQTVKLMVDCVCRYVDGKRK